MVRASWPLPLTYFLPPWPMAYPHGSDPLTPKRQPRLDGLDAARGIAAFVVMARHACVHALEGPVPVLTVPLPSATAVLFFYTLSGFTMHASSARLGHGLPAATRFLYGRATRIFPTYWLVLAATLLMWPTLAPPDRLASWVLLLPIALSYPAAVQWNAIPQAWTLHWESLFYLVFAASLLVFRRPVVLAAWLALITLVNTVPALASLPLLATLGSSLGLYFLTGVLVSWLSRHTAIPPALTTPLLCLGAVLCLASALDGTYGMFLPAHWYGTASSWIGFGTLLLGLAAITRTHAQARGLASWLGQVSYPLYVSHWLTMDLVFHLSAKASFDIASHPALHLALLLLASLAVAAALSAA